MPDAPPSIPDYTLLRRVGKGSYGEVWLARGVTGLFRAVKIVYRAVFEHDRPYEREFAGIKSFEPISRSQENLVDVLHVGRNDEAGYFYYVMELADDANGGGLKTKDEAPTQSASIPNSQSLTPATYQPKTLKEALGRSGRMSAAECLPISVGLTRAVAHLHSHGLIHRDLKPSNIIFVHGAPKVADIGLLSAVEESRSFVGTEGFVPPEGPGTPAADVFSLGKLLYEMSTGRDRLEFPKLPENFEEIPDRAALLEFNEVVLKSCDPEQSRRYPAAQELLNDLLLLQAGKSVRRLHLMESRFALAIKMAALTTLLTLLAGGAWIWATRQADEARRNFAQSEKHRVAAEAALRDAQLNQIRADRQSGWSGQRLETLAKLREAATATNSLALRNEAIACLAQADARLWRKIPFGAGRQLAWDRQLMRYATNDAAGNIFVRSAEDDRQLHFLPTPGARLYRLGFSPDDATLGASYLDERFCAWHLASAAAVQGVAGQLPLRFADLSGPARPHVFRLPRGAASGASTPDGRTLVVHCQDGSLHFIDPGTGETTRKFAGPIPGGAVSFNTSGSKFSLASTNEVHIYHAETGELLFPLRHPLNVTGLAWHPDGRRLASSCMDYKVRLWDTVTGQQVSGFEDHEAEAIAVAFDASGSLMASTGWDTCTRLWNPEASRPLVRIMGGGNGFRLAADGRRLAYSSWDHSRIELLEIIPGREMISLERFAGVYSVSFASDDGWLAGGSKQGVQLWQPPFFHPIATLPEHEGMAPIFHSMGQSLLSCGQAGVHEWPLGSESEPNQVVIGPMRTVGDSEGQPHPVIAITANGETVAGFTGDRVWASDRQGGNKRQRSVGDGPVAGLDLSPDGRWLAVALRREGAQVWTATDLKLVTNLGPERVHFSRFSPDGLWLLTASDRAYRFLETTTWRQAMEFPRDGGISTGIAADFCGPSALVALRDRPKAARLIDLNTWSEVAAVPVHLTTTALAFSPGGGKLAVATEKLGVQVWDLRLIREQLAALKLDWPLPPLAAPAARAEALKPPIVRVIHRLPPATNADPSLIARLPPRAADARPGDIDLTAHYNGDPRAGWIPGFQLGTTAEHALPMPQGIQYLAGTGFEVRGVVQLASSVLKGRGAKFPARANAISVNRACRRMHFLHGTDWSAPDGTTIGGFVIHYVTGEDRTVPIVMGQEVLDWWFNPAKPAKAGQPLAAWTGTNAASARQNSAIRIFKTTWENPLWDVEVSSVDFVSLQTKCGPFLLAITAE